MADLEEDLERIAELDGTARNTAHEMRRCAERLAMWRKNACEVIREIEDAAEGGMSHLDFRIWVIDALSEVGDRYEEPSLFSQSQKGGE